MEHPRKISEDYCIFANGKMIATFNDKKQTDEYLSKQTEKTETYKIVTYKYREK